MRTSAEFGFGTPWAEQIAHLRRKLALPTEWWDDIERGANDRAFIVAGAAKADLVQDLQGAMLRAAEAGSLANFRIDFNAIVAHHGWTGFTGEGSAAGVAWRTRIIYQTNMATSYAAGRWRQLNDPDFAALRPFWKYVHADGQLFPRPQHVAWNGLTLPRDHVFWKTHFAPNGWGCRCEITAVRAPAPGAATAPPPGWDKINPTTGAPVGIDKGWDYAPGADAATPLQQLVDRKLINLSAPIGAEMWQALRPALELERRLAWTDMVDRVASALPAQGDTVLATVVRPETVTALAAAGVELENAAVWLRDHELAHALRDTKAAIGTTLPAAVWRDLPELLAQAQPYLDIHDRALLYAIDAGGEMGKVVVRVNYNEKGRFGGVRLRITSNFIQTGARVDTAAILTDRRYVRLGGV